jgi:hypothetical protein
MLYGTDGKASNGEYTWCDARHLRILLVFCVSYLT